MVLEGSVRAISGSVIAYPRTNAPFQQGQRHLGTGALALGVFLLPLVF